MSTATLNVQLHFCTLICHSDGVRLSEGQRADLESVYAPYNKRLLRMLCERGYRNPPDWLSRYACIWLSKSLFQEHMK